jgi:hypothetical protein
LTPYFVSIMPIDSKMRKPSLKESLPTPRLLDNSRSLGSLSPGFRLPSMMSVLICSETCFETGVCWMAVKGRVAIMV